MILNHGFYYTLVPDKVETLVRTNNEPFNKTLLTNQKLQRLIKKRIKQESLHRLNENLYGEELVKKLVGFPQIRSWSSEYFLHREIQLLCRGDQVVNLHLSQLCVPNK